MALYPKLITQAPQPRVWRRERCIESKHIKTTTLFRSHRGILPVLKNMFWSTTPLILHSCLPGRLHLPTKKHTCFQKVYFNREHDAWQLKNLVRYELYTLIIIDGHPILSWKYKECSSFFPVIFGDAQRLDHLNWKMGRCFTSAPRTPFSELAERKKMLRALGCWWTKAVVSRN